MSNTVTAELTIEGLIHDLNNVFQTIAEIADVLTSDRRWSKLAGTLQRSVERGQRIAQSLLQDKPSSSDLGVVVEGAIEFVCDYLEAVHGPKVSFERRIDPGFRVTGDPAAWERVLVNLFLNSAEAGGTRIEIAATGAEITIGDDGPGIAPAMLPTIFQPHVSTKSITSGLGLYVVRSIVEEHGGTVTASNGATAGAVFRITVGQDGMPRAD
jgi:signal transduction histidine kinase